jgi:hypothetical protein
VRMNMAVLRLVPLAALALSLATMKPVDADVWTSYDCVVQVVRSTTSIASQDHLSVQYRTNGANKLAGIAAMTIPGAHSRWVP